MFSSWKKIVLLSAAVLMFSSCAKIPQEVVSPAISVKAVKGEEAGMVNLNFTGGLKNINDSTVFLNVKGEIAVMDSSENIVLTVPFELPSVLPFETGIIQEEISATQDEITPLLKDSGIDTEKFFKNYGSENFFPDDNKVILKILSLEKKGIVEILEGKIK
jgi:hypothetical protein